MRIAKLYCGVYDWPGNNQKLWRPRNSTGKWRWLNYDNDDCFRDADFNSLSHILDNTTNNDYPNPTWSTAIFRKAITNKQFKNDFAQCFEQCLNTVFKPSIVKTTLDSFKKNYEPEISEHIKRWNYPQSIDHWCAEVNRFEKFAEKRPEIIKKHLLDELNITVKCYRKSL